DNRQLAGLAIALCAFATALATGSNGFIAAFVAGIGFGATPAVQVPDSDESGDELPELSGELLALVVWYLFGAALVPLALDHLTWQVIAYAAASLTVLRMVPVALALLGTGLDRRSVAFIAWFGPRGLASVVFAVLAIEELGDSAVAADLAVGAVTLTVLASVILHGVTAGPAARSYGDAGDATATDGAAPRSRAGLISGRHHRRR
ncbi:MAG: cation:proton antiporter, partial [Acidimicrobiales bacterium]|nr:cation:proton antiporter [Acidimicrobiales bacterium]